jgi:hypothetical protein
MDQKTENAVALEQNDKKTYQTPVLADMGSITEITQGAVGTAGTDAGIYS